MPISFSLNDCLICDMYAMWYPVHVCYPIVICSKISHIESNLSTGSNWFPKHIWLGRYRLFTCRHLPLWCYHINISLYLVQTKWHALVSCHTCDGLLSHPQINYTSHFTSNLVQARQYIFDLWNLCWSHLLMYTNRLDWYSFFKNLAYVFLLLLRILIWGILKS